MQTSRPNAVSRKAQQHGLSSSSSHARSTSPLDLSSNGGGAPRSPLTATTARLTSQLGSMSMKGASASALPSSPSSSKIVRPSISHRKSKSVSSTNTRGGRSSESSPSKPTTTTRTSTSPVKPSLNSRSSSSTSSHARTPSRSQAAALLSKSAGPLNSTTSRDSLIAAGGLGRMDIVTKDWDGLASSGSGSGSNSPQKRRPAVSAKKYDRFIPSRENSTNSANSAVEENTTSNFTNNSRKSSKPLKSDPDDSFEAERSATSEGDAAAASANLDGFDDSPPHTQHYHQDHTDQAHTAELSSSLGIELGRRILSFSAEPPPASNEHSSLLAAYARGEGGGIGRGAGSSHQTSIAASQRRRIATTPERVLDAPGLADDYYLNLLDWSATNLVAIALSEAVYIWNAESGEVGCLCTVGNPDEEETDEIVTSVKFSEDGSYLAIGTSTGLIQIYDLSTSSRIRTMAGHATRVPTLSWSGAILSSGSRDGSIWNSDVRVAQHKVAEMNGHRAEVCGLEWRKDTGLSGAAAGGSVGGQGLLASGGNDNIVNVWDGRMLSAPKMVKTNHTAAVKALAWCPWQSSLLATGGGQGDKTIHFWNTTTSARLNSLVTPSQVTSLVFNPHSREILSSHGYPDNQLSIWTYPTLSKVVDITQAHEYRVLHSCISPDGTTVATASSDENLKFWKVFDLPKKSASSAVGMGPNGHKIGEGKNEHDVGRRGRTGLAIR